MLMGFKVRVVNGVSRLGVWAVWASDVRSAP